MSIFDGHRLPPQAFRLDIERLRRGYYTDRYFVNIANILPALSNARRVFAGRNPRRLPPGLDARALRPGDCEVEMQVFPRRAPFTIVAGVDKAVAILRECTGYFDERGLFVNTFAQTRLEAVQDGFKAMYAGDPESIVPIIRIRGRYRDFAILETPVLGVLARCSRIATNTYLCLDAGGGKPVLQFGARFDAPEVQAMDGYGYWIGVRRYSLDSGNDVAAFVSTDAQGEWWGGIGSGTISHAYIACFLTDIEEAMLAFAEHMPPDVKRIALVDFNNDCVGDSLRAARSMFERYMALTERGKDEEAQKFILFGVRPDTGGNLVDVALQPTDDFKADCGTSPRLLFALRQTLDNAYLNWDLPPKWQAAARQYCRNIKIVATGGFGPERIRRFEQVGAPVDIFGVGSALLSWCSTCGTSTDFTADVVRVKVQDEWVDMAKVGRKPCDNPDLQPVE